MVMDWLKYLLVMILPLSCIAQPKFKSGYLPSSDGKFTFAKNGDNYYLVSLSDSTRCQHYLNFNPDTIPNETELYQYSVDEKRGEIEFSFYDRRIIEQQVAERGRIYDRPKGLMKMVCYYFP